MRGAKPSDHRLGFAAHLLCVDEPDSQDGARKLPAEKYVRSNVAHPGEREVLVDHLDPRLADFAGILADYGNAVEVDVAAVGPVHAGDRLHERRLAGPVVANQRYRAAGLDRERDPAQSLDRAESLADVLQLEKTHRRQPSLLLMRSSQTARISTAPMAICW